MAGRLTLTWANKDRALLSHGETGYEWADRDDPRVREVRLLDEIEGGRVGQVTGTAADNLLIRGDSLDAVRALVRSPEYAAEYRGKVKLVYIDPPFNTGQAFEHYDDALEHSVWLGMMRERLVLIRDLLAPDGSVWVHLDDAEMAYCKVLMDEVFGRQNFIATVVWQKAPGGKGRASFAWSHDYIMVFARTPDWAEGRNLMPRTDTQLGRYANPDNDPRGPWRQGADGTAKSGGDDSRWPITLPSGRTVTPTRGRFWAFSRATYERAHAEGRVYFGKDGDRQPIIKTYLSEAQAGTTPITWWPAAESGSNQEAKRDHLNRMFPDADDPFDTPKPERLLERVIHIGSNPGDIVLDCFAGSGTTAAVAHKMGRRWVTVELNESTADTFTAPRLTKVVNNEDPGGITQSVGWEGGGGFRQLRVAPSPWQVEDGEAYLRDGVDPATLARAVAAQLGYAPVEHPVFVGRKGRAQLAVVHGVADTTVVEDVVSALEEGQTAQIAALAIADGAASLLADLRPGSRLIRITTDLFPRTPTVTR